MRHAPTSRPLARATAALSGALAVTPVCALISFASLSDMSADAALISDAAPLVIVLALVAAAVCWRATKRWHSP